MGGGHTLVWRELAERFVTERREQRSKRITMQAEPKAREEPSRIHVCDVVGLVASQQIAERMSAMVDVRDQQREQEAQGHGRADRVRRVR
jgi:hypothetical protein